MFAHKVKRDIPVILMLNHFTHIFFGGNHLSPDRVVIAAPFWDLGFPALLKLYIENICVDGITFGANETGVFGLCKAKRLLFLTTRGGDYSSSPLEMGARYLEALSEFWGIPRFDAVSADGLDLGLEPVRTILNRAIEVALGLVENF